MKILVNTLQILLALWIITGSIYMMGHYQTLASSWVYRILPGAFWVALGVVQIILAIVLLASVKFTLRKYAVPSAIGLAIIVLAGVFLYGSYAGVGLLWAIVPATLFLFIAHKRHRELSSIAY